MKHFEKAAHLIENNKIALFWVNLNKILFEATKIITKDRNANLELMYSYIGQNKYKLNEGRMLKETEKII